MMIPAMKEALAGVFAETTVGLNETEGSGSEVHFVSMTSWPERALSFQTERWVFGFVVPDGGELDICMSFSFTVLLVELLGDPGGLGVPGAILGEVFFGSTASC